MAQLVLWLGWFGYRNLAYAAFVALLFPFAMAVEAGGPHGPDSGGGVMTALLLWAAVSSIFFTVNAVLLAVALFRQRSPAKPLIACGLPVLCVVLPLALGPLFVR